MPQNLISFLVALLPQGKGSVIKEMSDLIPATRNVFDELEEKLKVPSDDPLVKACASFKVEWDEFAKAAGLQEKKTK